MLKNIIICLIMYGLPLISQDFLKNIQADKLKLDKIEKAPIELQKEINIKGFIFWSGLPGMNLAYSKDSLLCAKADDDGLTLIYPKTKEEIKITDGTENGKRVIDNLKFSFDNKFLAFCKIIPHDELLHGKTVYKETDELVYDIQNHKFQTLPSGTDYSYQWAPQGNLLAGDFIDSTNSIILYVYDPINDKIKTIDKSIFFEPFNFSWSPNGEMLTYVVATKASGEAEVSPLESDVYIINKDGSGKNQITHTLQPEVLVKWMSDGKSIVVDRYKEKPDSNMGGGEKEIVLLHLSK